MSLPASWMLPISRKLLTVSFSLKKLELPLIVLLIVSNIVSWVVLGLVIVCR